MYIYRGSSSPVGNLTQISQIADKISAISASYEIYKIYLVKNCVYE